jgi:hypothetical protein
MTDNVVPFDRPSGADIRKLIALVGEQNKKIDGLEKLVTALIASHNGVNGTLTSVIASHNNIVARLEELTGAVNSFMRADDCAPDLDELVQSLGDVVGEVKDIIIQNDLAHLRKDDRQQAMMLKGGGS